MSPRDVHLHLEDGLHFVARTASGFEVHMDSRVEGEPEFGPTPMEMQLVTLGGCTGRDAASILRKMRQDVTSYDLRLSAERAPEHPRVYTSILITHSVRGRALVEANVRRAIELTMTRYCPVFAMLHPTVQIREVYEITDEAGGAAVTGEVEVDWGALAAAGA